MSFSVPLIRRRMNLAGGLAGALAPAGQTMDTASGYYEKVNSAYLQGNTTGFTRYVGIYIPSGWTAPGASEVLWSYRGASGVRSWIIRTTSTGEIDCYAHDGFGAYVTSPKYKIQDWDKGKFHLITMVVDVTAQTVRLYFDAYNVGATSGLSSYGGPTTGDALAIGAIGGGTFPVATVETLFAGGTDSVIATEAQVAAHYQAFRSAGTGVAMGLTGELWWNVDSAAAAPSSWEDETGTETLTKSGTVTVNDNDFAADDIIQSVKSFSTTASVFRGGANVTAACNPNGTWTTYGVLHVPAYMDGLTAFPSGNDFLFNRGNTSVTRGFVFRLLNAGQPYFCYEQADGTGTLRRTPLSGSANMEPYAGKRVPFVATHDGTTIRLYVNGTQAGSGTACSGATVPAGGDFAFLLGPGSLFCEDLFVVALGFTDGDVADAGEIATWTAAAKVNVPPAMGLTDELYFSPDDLSATGNWPDSTATANMAEQAGGVDRMWVRNLYA